MSNAERARRTDPRDALIRAGLEIIERDGVGAVTNRSLARLTHYSPSAVGYHTQPLHEFVDLLWKHLGSDLAEAVFTRRSSFEQCADQLITWTDHHPKAAAFFVEHSPIQPSSTRPDYWTFLGGVDASQATDIETISLLQLLSRRLQAALACAMNATTDAAARRTILADELRSMAEQWRRWRSTST